MNVIRFYRSNLVITLSALALSGFLATPALSQTKAPEATTNARQTHAAQPPLSSQQSTDGIIALVNDTPILKSELSTAVSDAKMRLQQLNQPITNEQRLQNEILNSLILRKLQLDMVNRAGIRPQPEKVNQRLAQIAQAQGLTSLKQLQQLLDTNKPGSYAKLRARIIEDEALKTLQQSQVTNRVRITDQDVDAFLTSPEAQRLTQTEYRTIHIRVPFTDDVNRITEAQQLQAMQIAKQAVTLLQSSDDAQTVLQQLSDTAAKDYPVPVQGGDMGFHAASGLPTDMAAKIVPLSKGDVTPPQITAQGIDVVKLVDKRGQENMIIPQWRVRHILISNENMGSDALAQQKINDLYEQLRHDADFASLASTYSDDPGSAGRGGDLDWVAAGQMVPEFEAMMQRTPVGDYSTPFKTQFGWHILKVEETRQQDVSKTVRYNLAREALYQRLAPQAQEDWLQELQANAYIKIFD